MAHAHTMKRHWQDAWTKLPITDVGQLSNAPAFMRPSYVQQSQESGGGVTVSCPSLGLPVHVEHVQLLGVCMVICMIMYVSCCVRVAHNVADNILNADG
eukprot:351309-Chlamydomonas_euryale.AAC.9